MNTYPMTFSLETSVRRRLVKQVPPRKRSRYVSDAVSTKLVSDLINKHKKDPWKEFFALGKKLNLNISTKQIIEAKNYGRE